MSIPLSEATLSLVDGRNYGVLATVNPDGSPQTSVLWVGRDGGSMTAGTPARTSRGAVRVVVRMVVEKATGYAS